MTLKPSQLFLIDSLGALGSAIMHGIILRHFHQLIGIPQRTLLYLAIVALLFSMYSMLCFILKPKNWQTHLKRIGFANIGFCLVTLIVLAIFKTEVTRLGIAFFMVEILIIFILAIYELRFIKH